MTRSENQMLSEDAAFEPSVSLFSSARAWSLPTFSPEHGVYVMLFVSFMTGAAAAQAWNLETTLALVAALAGFQAEHPIVLQIKQRRSWKPRFVLWAGLYGGLALGLSIFLYVQTPILLWFYGGAIAAFSVDVVSVFFRKQRSIPNELITFAAVCLSTPLAYVSTTGSWTISIMGLWLLNTLFFSSAIFSVKLRKPQTASVLPGLIYHAIATLIVLGLWQYGWLSSVAALAFGIGVLKFAFILVRQEWYRITAIQNVALLETLCAMIFLISVAISLLPAHLS